MDPPLILSASIFELDGVLNLLKEMGKKEAQNNRQVLTPAFQSWRNQLSSPLVRLATRFARDASARRAVAALRRNAMEKEIKRSQRRSRCFCGWRDILLRKHAVHVFIRVSWHLRLLGSVRSWARLAKRRTAARKALHFLETRRLRKVWRGWREHREEGVRGFLADAKLRDYRLQAAVRTWKRFISKRLSLLERLLSGVRSTRFHQTRSAFNRWIQKYNESVMLRRALGVAARFATLQLKQKVFSVWKERAGNETRVGNALFRRQSLRRGIFALLALLERSRVKRRRIYRYRLSAALLRWRSRSKRLLRLRLLASSLAARRRLKVWKAWKTAFLLRQKENRGVVLERYFRIARHWRWWQRALRQRQQENRLVSVGQQVFRGRATRRAVQRWIGWATDQVKRREAVLLFRKRGRSRMRRSALSEWRRYAVRRQQQRYRFVERIKTLVGGRFGALLFLRWKNVCAQRRQIRAMWEVRRRYLLRFRLTLLLARWSRRSRSRKKRREWWMIGREHCSRKRKLRALEALLKNSRARLQSKHLLRVGALWARRCGLQRAVMLWRHRLERTLEIRDIQDHLLQNTRRTKIKFALRRWRRRAVSGQVILLVREHWKSTLLKKMLARLVKWTRYCQKTARFVSILRKQQTAFALRKWKWRVDAFNQRSALIQRVLRQWQSNLCQFCLGRFRAHVRRKYRQKSRFSAADSHLRSVSLHRGIAAWKRLLWAARWSKAARGRADRHRALNAQSIALKKWFRWSRRRRRTIQARRILAQVGQKELLRHCLKNWSAWEVSHRIARLNMQKAIDWSGALVKESMFHRWSVWTKGKALGTLFKRRSVKDAWAAWRWGFKLRACRWVMRWKMHSASRALHSWRLYVERVGFVRSVFVVAGKRLACYRVLVAWRHWIRCRTTLRDAEIRLSSRRLTVLQARVLLEWSTAAKSAIQRRTAMLRRALTVWRSWAIEKRHRAALLGEFRQTLESRRVAEALFSWRMRCRSDLFWRRLGKLFSAHMSRNAAHAMLVAWRRAAAWTKRIAGPLLAAHTRSVLLAILREWRMAAKIGRSREDETVREIRQWLVRCSIRTEQLLFRGAHLVPLKAILTGWKRCAAGRKGRRSRFAAARVLMDRYRRRRALLFLLDATQSAQHGRRAVEIAHLQLARLRLRQALGKWVTVAQRARKCRIAALMVRQRQFRRIVSDSWEEWRILAESSRQREAENRARLHFRSSLTRKCFRSWWSRLYVREEGVARMRLRILRRFATKFWIQWKDFAKLHRKTFVHSSFSISPSLQESQSQTGQKVHAVAHVVSFAKADSAAHKEGARESNSIAAASNHEEGHPDSWKQDAGIRHAAASCGEPEPKFSANPEVQAAG